MADNSTDNKKAGGPSAMLLIVGVLALLVSIWALIGPAALPFGGIPIGWILVFTAIVVGGILVLTPRRRR
ncbi:hypothetical protein D5S18_23785 [Nocardia panacis]|uniref:Uncharacterized protein n=1 Tax=Nocardia panacis TaxID=2340916 RepID=A0A3A4KH66_9NOCA|nr:hypothetical protein [Nocardia panacis]RJO72190.1 hypothetical protein D5S18_23785 [Nocardia panacis]